MFIFLNPACDLPLFTRFYDYVIPISLNLTYSYLEFTETGECTAMYCITSNLIFADRNVLLKSFRIQIQFTFLASRSPSFQTVNLDCRS